MDDIISLVKLEKEREIKNSFNEFNQLTVKEQQAVGKDSFIKQKVYVEALKIAGDTIYDLSCERDIYKEELENNNLYDEHKVNNLIKSGKLNTNNKSKSDIILKELRKSMLKSKQLTKP